MESFWARMQVELLNRKRWNTRLELANAIFEYLEIFHNRQRRHSSLGMLSPIEYELRHTTPSPAIKQADRAKPRAHESLQEARGDSRFHRILLEEWAYIRHWNSETERHQAYTGFIHFYNHHRPHGSLGWATPASILKDNLPTEHS